MSNESLRLFVRDKQDRYYKEYLKSPEWAAQRTKALLLAESRCQVCYSDSRLQVHHRTYRNLGDEEPSDLIVLCRYCHHLFHSNGRLKSATPTTPLQEKLTVAKKRDTRREGLVAFGPYVPEDRREPLHATIPLYDPLILLHQLKDDLSLEAMTYHLGADIETVNKWMEGKGAPNKKHRKNAAKVYNYWKENGSMIGFQSHSDA